MRKRSGNIDLIKFFLAMVIIIFHGRTISKTAQPLFPQGQFAVEVFFMIAGYYMAKTAIERKKDTFRYIGEKYLSFFPYHAFCFLMAFISAVILRNVLSAGVTGLLKLLLASIPEFLILPPLMGMQYDMANINGIEWYLAAMILGMLIVYPMVKAKPALFCTTISPVLFLAISGYFFEEYKATYNWTYHWNGWMCLGVLRAVAHLSAGCTIYWLTERYTIKSRLLATITGLVCWVVVFAFMNSRLESKYEFAVIYVVIAALFVSFSQRSYLAELCNSKLVLFLGKLSFPLFLNQSWTRKVLTMYNPGYGYVKTEVIFILFTVAVSLLCVVVMDNVMKLVQGREQKWHRRIIEPKSEE